MMNKITNLSPSRSPDNWPRAVIIILNWNGWKDSLECLESIYNIEYSNYKVVLLDNGSSDDSILEIKKYIHSESDLGLRSSESDSTRRPIDLVELCLPFGTPTETGDCCSNLEGLSNNRIILARIDRNVGFARGNNIAIRLALDTLCPDYFLLLNNDTVVDRSFLRELVLAGEEFRDAAFLSPKIYFYEHEGRRDIIQYAGGKQNLWACSFTQIGFLEADRGQYELTQKTEFAHGSCMLVRATSIMNIGLLDEDFFSYREENDWALRGRHHGWLSYYVPQSKIWHKGGGSGGRHDCLTVYYIARNDFVFMKKNASRIQYLAFICTFMIYKSWLNSIRYLAIHRRPELFRAFVYGSAEGLRWKKRL